MTGFFAWSMIAAEDQTLFLPGHTTSGHYQIELACESCHTSSFTSEDDMQQACLNCHAEELELANDSHPVKKFLDPRNADLLEKIDARQCVSCHMEHRPEITQTMGVTVPDDVCFHCHEDVGENRVTHADLPFGTGEQSCASAGCHNYHDNRALYEDFLLKHAEQPSLLTNQQLPEKRTAAEYVQTPGYPTQRHTLQALTIADTNWQDYLNADVEHNSRVKQVTEAWSVSAHAEAGVDCQQCHAEDNSTAWVEHPGFGACMDCHQDESDTFKQGKHGMRLAELSQPLSPMTPGISLAYPESHLAFQADSTDTELNCGTCHDVHRVDVQHAAVDGCLSCHTDEHSLAYKDSKHYQLWQTHLTTGSGADGVTCATCHMPRVEKEQFGEAYIMVQHNQNATLKPNEKMLRPVCQQCHGLEFSINALADEVLIKNNFIGQPSKEIQSINMVLDNLERDKARRQ